MRVVPVDELDRGLFDERATRVVFPFSSERAARAGDPSVHVDRDARDLYAVALLNMTSRLGAPDYPNSMSATPAIFAASNRDVAAWDFDYYALLLEVVAIDPGADAYAVQVRRYPSAAPALDDSRAAATLRELADELRPFLGRGACSGTNMAALERAVEGLAYVAYDVAGTLELSAIDGFVLRDFVSPDVGGAKLVGVLIAIDGSLMPLELGIVLDGHSAAITYFKLRAGDKRATSYGGDAWRWAAFPGRNEWLGVAEFRARKAMP